MKTCQLFLFTAALISLAGCRMAPTKTAEREPQAVDDGENRPKTWVRYHSRHIEGNEVPLVIIQAFKNKKLVMFGEMHGTNEMPAYAAAVITHTARKYPNIYVGLEFPPEIQPNIDQYMKTGDARFLKSTKFFNDPALHSGRGSQAMVGLLNELRKAGDIRVFCFDMPPSKKEGRETLMAKKILSVISEVNSPKMVKLLEENKKQEALRPIRDRRNLDPMFFVFTGNIHSRLTPGWPDNPEAPTMGSELNRLTNGGLNEENVMSILFRYQSGTAWNCQMINGRLDCGQQLLQESRSSYTDMIDDSRYFLKERELTDGHNYTIFMREVTASNPF